jgi:hypothetical protein
MAFRRSPVRSRSGPPSFAHASSRRSVSFGSASHPRRMPRRSGAKRRGGGPVSPLNELRLGKPSVTTPSSAVIPPDGQEHRGSCKPSPLLRSQRLPSVWCAVVVSTRLCSSVSARTLPSLGHAGRQAIRLRSQECRSEATFLRRLHLGRQRPPCRPQRWPLPPHRPLPSLAAACQDRTS